MLIKTCRSYLVAVLANFLPVFTHPSISNAKISDGNVCGEATIDFQWRFADPEIKIHGNEQSILVGILELIYFRAVGNNKEATSDRKTFSLLRFFPIFYGVFSLAFDWLKSYEKVRSIANSLVQLSLLRQSLLRIESF